MIDSQDTKHWSLSIGRFLLLALVIAIATALRFYNLRTIPNWHIDEGDFISLARNYNFFSATQHCWASIVPPTAILRLPLFSALVSFAFKLFGNDILILRSVAAFCGVFTVLFVYLTVEAAAGFRAAIYSALTLAVWPEAIFFGRIGLSYSLLTLLVSIFIYVSWKFYTTNQSRFLALTALTTGLAFSADYSSIALIPVFCILIFLRRPRHSWLYLLICAVPPALFLLPVLIGAPHALLDHAHTLYALGSRTAISQSTRLAFFIQFYGNMLRKESLVLFGMVGLLFIPDTVLRRLTACTVFAFMLLLGAIKYLSEQYMLPIYALLAPSIGIAFSILTPRVADAFQDNLTSMAKAICPSSAHQDLLGFLARALKVPCLVFLLGAPFMFLLCTDISLVSPQSTYMVFPFKLMSSLFPDSLQPANEVQQVANYLNPLLKPNEATLAPPNVGWLLRGNTTVPLETPHCEKAAKGAPSEIQFAFDCSVANLTYVVLDPYSLGLTSKENLEEIQKWPVVFSAGTLTVYQNPGSRRN